MSSLSLPAVPPSLADRVAAASTFSQLVDAIPLPYRDALRTHLAHKYRLAHKHAALCRLCSSYQALLDRGSCPPAIATSIQPPSLRFSTSFLTTPEYTLGTASLQAALRTARQTLLAAVIAVRSAELASLSALLQPDFDSWNHLVTNVASTLAHPTAPTLIQGDNCVLNPSGISPNPQHDYVAILGACSVFTHKLLSLARTARSCDTRPSTRTDLTSGMPFLNLASFSPCPDLTSYVTDTLRPPTTRLHPSGVYNVRKGILKTRLSAGDNASRSSSSK